MVQPANQHAEFAAMVLMHGAQGRDDTHLSRNFGGDLETDPSSRWALLKIQMLEGFFLTLAVVLASRNSTGMQTRGVRYAFFC